MPIALIISILLAFAAGGLAGLATMGSMSMYQLLNLPPLAPPGWLFPAVWGVLYLLMGISAYLIYRTDAPQRELALKLYFVQLAVNMIWPILFFDLKWYGFALIWLVLLWLLIRKMIRVFGEVDTKAAWLQLPYLIWVSFAAYLNLGVLLMN